MALFRPILDDRSYEQLRDDLVRRIPVYNREWTDHNASDPGITLLELFAFLGENLLYRFNQIPETTYIEFLNLLQIPRIPAAPARALVAASDGAFALIPRGSEVRAGSVAFQTLTELRVLPVTGIAVCKASAPCPSEEEEPEVFVHYQRTLDALDGLAASEQPVCYQNRAVPAEDDGTSVDFNEAVDGVLWLAITSTQKNDVTLDERRKAILAHEAAPLLLNIGLIAEQTPPPAAEVLACPGGGLEDTGPAVDWQISTGEVRDDEPVYRRLQVRGDTTRGLTRSGAVRLQLPSDPDAAGVFSLDDQDLAGTGPFPPRLDDETEARILFWLRAFRPDGSRFGRVRHVAANATEVEQTVPARPEFLGTGTGQPHQAYRLVNRSVVAGSVELEVEGADGWQPWTEVDGFHASLEGDTHFVVDAEAGLVRFGNGIQGYPPQIGQRIRVVGYRFGGGRIGNVAAGAITKLVRLGDGGTTVPSVKLANPLPAHGGADAETLEVALDRIPGELRRRNRAVTPGDFRELSLQTPGADIGRAETIPLFRASSPDQAVAGAVSVVVWPREDRARPNAPLPDRNQLRAVCRYLDERRLVTTELYVIPPTYHRVAVSIGLQVKPGYGIEAVRHWVELVLRQYLAPLPPFGPSGEGWPLGRRVHAPELEAAALQVEGVEYLEGLTLAGFDEAQAQWVAGTPVTLRRFEVPELAEITVLEGQPLADPSEGLGPPPPERTPVPVPLLREEC